MGPTLVNVLLACGYRVRILARKTICPSLLSNEVEVVHGDLLDTVAMEKAVSEASIVFHLAAMLHNPHPDRNLESVYHEINVQGTMDLFNASQNAGVKRFVFFSTIAVYGKGHFQESMSEKSKPTPQTFYERTKYEAENRLLANKGGGTEVTILRLASVYGPRIKGNYKTMIKVLAKGLLVYPGKGDNHRTLIHEKDVARAALLAAKHPGTAWQLYNITDGTTHTMRQIIDSIIHGLHSRVRVYYMPAWLSMGVLKLLGMAGLNKSKSYQKLFNTITKMNEHMAVSGAKFQVETGFKPEWDLPTGMAEVVEIITRNNQ